MSGHDGRPDHPDLERALNLASYGDIAQAIEVTRRLLGSEPERAYAHALLAYFLLQTGRRHGARCEAEIALQLDPGLSQAHLLLGDLAVHDRRFSDAESYYLEARRIDPDWSTPLVHLALLREIQGRRRDVEELLLEARRLEPESAEIAARLSSHYRVTGRLGDAWTHARAATSLDPESALAHAAIGEVMLVDGQVQAAGEAARDALRLDPNCTEALLLLSSVKARSSFFLGLWWRYSVWMERLGEARSLGVLMGVWFVVQLLRTWLQGEKLDDVAEATGFLWLGICAYSWVAPAVFRRAVARETGRVVAFKEF